MLIKFLKMTVDYLMGGKTSEGKPRYKPPVVLRGSPELSKRLTEQLTGRDRFASFVCMDELDWEKFGGHEAFEEFADMVERDLFVGMEKGDYNTLWVRHPREDGKTEVNLYCPNLHLPTGNKIKTYYSKVDKGRLYDLMALYSRERGLSCARDPRRKRPYKPIDFTPKRKKQTADEITDMLLQEIWAGKVHNREDVIQHLKDRGFELARTGKYLSIKVEEGSNLRLRGWPYEPDFDSSQRKKEIQEAHEDFCLRDQKRIQTLRWKYARKLVKRRRRHRQRYPRREKQPEPILPEQQSELTTHEKDVVGILTQFARRLGGLIKAEQTSPENPAGEGTRPLPAQGFFGFLRRFSFRHKMAVKVRGHSPERRRWLLGLSTTHTSGQRDIGDIDR